MKFPEFLVDKIGRRYPHRNQWMQDIIDAEKADDQQTVKRLEQEKDQHPYILALSEYKEAEKAYLKQKKNLMEQFEEGEEQDPYIQKLRSTLQAARFDRTFYEPYIGLTYDSDLHYKQATLLTQMIPLMSQTYQDTLDELREVEASSIDQEAEDQYAKTLAEQKEILQAEKSASDQKLKNSYAEGNISKKAYKKGLKGNKRHYKNEIDTLKSSAPTQARKEKISYLKHRLKQLKASNEKVLKEELTDISHSTPIEVEKERKWLPWLTALIPGVGQLVHRQYLKALLFFIGTFFIYMIALPYALGFGNYQGDGLAGLLHLGIDGARLDRSIIFMIEGIIAIIMTVFSAIIILINTIDVKQVEADLSKGIRPANTFEIKKAIRVDGFPYVVNIPAVILIAFIVLVPIITTFLLSFTNMDPDHQSKFTWIGLENYLLIFKGEGLAGGLFWKILGWTVIWTLAATTLQIFIGFVLGLLTNNERIRGKRFFRTVYILPWAIPAFVTILFFSIMASPNGYFSNLLADLFGTTVEIKNSTHLTRIAVILLQGWLGSSYIFLLTSGVLQSIPADLYEAADIDGASSWQTLSKITIPLVLFQIAPLLISQYTFNFNNYSIIALFNGGGPFNPTEYGNLAGSTDILVSYIFKLVTQNEYQAIGAAITMLISMVLMVITFISYSRSQAFKEG